MERAEFDKQLALFLPTLLQNALKLFDFKNQQDAEDLCQDTIMTALQKLDQAHEGTFKGWLLRIQVNLFNQHYRRREYMLPLPFDELQQCNPASDDPDESLASHNPLDSLARLLNRASSVHRSVVLTHLRTDGVRREMARLLDVTDTRVGGMMQKFREWAARNKDRVPNDNNHPYGAMRPILANLLLQSNRLDEDYDQEYVSYCFEDKEASWNLFQNQCRDVGKKLGISWESVRIYVDAVKNGFPVRVPTKEERQQKVRYAHDVLLSYYIDPRLNYADHFSQGIRVALDVEKLQNRPGLFSLNSPHLNWLEPRYTKQSVDAWLALRGVHCEDPVMQITVEALATRALRHIIDHIRWGIADDRSIGLLIDCD